MRSHDPAHQQVLRRRRHLALLVGAASLLGLGGTLPARAQDAGSPAGPTGQELFSIYQLEARGLGVSASYRIEGLIPGDTPILDFGSPETLARFGDGPSGYGLASMAYPGGIPTSMDALVTQSGGDGSQIPPYPIKAEAFYPAGPTEDDTSQAGLTQKVVSSDRGVQSTGSFPAIAGSPLVTVGSIQSASRSAIEGSLGVSRSRVSLSDLSILGGVITIDSLVTDLVAVHSGGVGSTAGGTTASGVRFLGLDASLTEKGLVLKPAPSPEGPAAPLGSPLGAAAGPLGSITGPLQGALSGVLDQAVPQVNTLLAQAGITLAILDPHDQQVSSGAATRLTSGLSLTFSYKGREQQAMVDLINAIPAQLKPAIGPIPNPITFLAENHIYALSLAPATVSALAAPPFDSVDFPIAPSLPFDPGEAPWSSIMEEPGFSATPAPLLAPSGPRTPQSPSLGEPISAVASGAVPAILVALALLASPLFGMGSRRLADGVLAGASRSCPIGLDEPPSAPRPL